MIRNRRYTSLILLFAIFMVMGFATFCMASSEGPAVPVPAPSGTTPAFGNWYVIGWTAVNFLLLLSLIYKFGYGPINAMLEERSATIEGSLKHAEEVKTEVEQMRKEVQANLQDSRKESQEIVARATKAAEDVKNEMMAKAQEDATNVKNKAHAEIAAATEQAKAQLKDSAVALAISAAEKVLGRAITEDDHKRMVKDFVNEAGDLLC